MLARVGALNPNGVVSQSPRLLYSATLGTPAPRHPKPQRGCVPEPKVAVLSYLGNTGAATASTPTGLCPRAQGCCTQLPWEHRRRDSLNPNGVVSQSPRLLYSATLGTPAPRQPQPQRGCVLWPNSVLLSTSGLPYDIPQPQTGLRQPGLIIRASQEKTYVSILIG